MTFYINKKEPCASAKLGVLLSQCISSHSHFWDELVFLCIGSTRITGDSLGPYIGEHLSSLNLPNTSVYGTLYQPVHALNLEYTIKKIYTIHPAPLLVAIDASLGSRQHLGYITLGKGALYPGAGVHKNLPPVGDISITGIISHSGMFEHLFLQTTRLSAVTSLADVILDGILSIYPKRTPPMERPFHKSLR